MAVLVLWRRSSTADDPAVDDALPTSAELLDRGFARLPAPTVEQLLALPHLTQAEVRLPAGGGLHIDDGPRTLLEGARYRASDDWHAPPAPGGSPCWSTSSRTPTRPGTSRTPTWPSGPWPG